MKAKPLLTISSCIISCFIASLVQGAESDCDNAFELLLPHDVPMRFCEIPEKKGVPIGDPNGIITERTIIPRNFNRFYMAQYEVTQEQYKAVMSQEPWKGKSSVIEGPSYPAVYINHSEAIEFTQALNIIDDTTTYHLPTEAEWEYAARGKEYSNSSYYWGEEINPLFAFYDKNSEDTAEYAREVTSCPSAVLQEEATGYCGNDFGLMHMSGNVAEWVRDSYYRYSKATKNGHEPIIYYYGSNEWVSRGGSWRHSAWYLRSAARPGLRGYKTNFRSNFLGFRVVRVSK